MPKHEFGNNPEMGKINKPCNYGPNCNKKETCRFDHGEGNSTHKVFVKGGDYTSGGGGFKG